MRTLDRKRPYAQISPPEDGAVYAQDDGLFDLEGRLIRTTGASSARAKPAKAPPAPPELGDDDDGGADLVAVTDLGWNDLRKLSKKMDGPVGLGIKRADVLKFLEEDGTTHVTRASLSA